MTFPGGEDENVEKGNHQIAEIERLTLDSTADKDEEDKKATTTTGQMSSFRT